MRFDVAIDEYVLDMWSQGRFTSPATDRNYRLVLYAHADDVDNRDPRKTGRDDVKRTLRRWSHPNSQRKNRSVLISFYDWLVEEGERPHNPARQTPKPRRRPVTTHRLSRDEVAALLNAVQNERERRVIYLGVFAGLRNGELRGLRGWHFERDGFIWVSADIGKGGKERWVPVSDELAPVVARIRFQLTPDDYVLPAQRWRNPPVNSSKLDLRKHPSSSQALRSLVQRVAKRAGISGRIYPHLMRHAFAEQMTRHAGLRQAQHMLGHSDSRTTEIYLGKPTPDELKAAIEGFTFGVLAKQAFLSTKKVLANPVEAPTGIEPV
jgi:site-specific recombinase XerD